jgi:hypothetical protein
MEVQVANDTVNVAVQITLSRVEVTIRPVSYEESLPPPRQDGSARSPGIIKYSEFGYEYH